MVLVDGHRCNDGARDTLSDMGRRHLIPRLRGGGADVVDLEPAYARQAAGTARALDVGPDDGHRNALGVGPVMTQAAPALRP